MFTNNQIRCAYLPQIQQCWLVSPKNFLKISSPLIFPSLNRLKNPLTFPLPPSLLISSFFLFYVYVQLVR